jgi:hypothetical protein
MRRATLAEQLALRNALEAIPSADRSRVQARELEGLQERHYRRLTRLDARILYTRQKLNRLEAIVTGRQDEG